MLLYYRWIKNRCQFSSLNVLRWLRPSPKSHEFIDFPSKHSLFSLGRLCRSFFGSTFMCQIYAKTQDRSTLWSFPDGILARVSSWCQVSHLEGFLWGMRIQLEPTSPFLRKKSQWCTIHHLRILPFIRTSYDSCQPCSFPAPPHSCFPPPISWWM